MLLGGPLLPSSLPPQLSASWQTGQAQGWTTKGTTGSSDPKSLAAKVPYKAAELLKSARIYAREVTPATSAHSPAVSLPCTEARDSLARKHSP